MSSDRRVLKITFDDGRSFELPAEFLRVLSPSAEVQGHSPEQRQIVDGKRNVTVRAVDPVGNYAVRLTFDDGHNTGIYTWRYLRDLGDRQTEMWAGYLDDLEQSGRDRG